MALSNISAVLSKDAATEQGAFYTAVFSYGTGLVQLLSDWGYKPAGQDTKVRVPIECDISGAAEVYDEGDGLPDWIEPNAQLAAFTVKSFRAVIRQTGHERRGAGEAGEASLMPGLVNRKINAAIDRIKYLIATTYDDDAAYGIQDLIDDTANFGALSRTTYDKLVSYLLDASSAAVSTSILNNFYHRSQNDPYGCAFDLCLASSVQCSKMAELGSGKLAIASADQAGGMNLVPTDLRIGTAPVVMMPNLSTSIILGLTGARMRPPGEMTGGPGWGVVWCEPNPGRFHYLDLGAGEADNPMRGQVSTALAVCCTAPQRQGKIHTLSTT